MKKATLIFVVMLTAVTSAFAQVKIGDNPGTISPGSLLELESTSKALALPRMSTVQMQAIPSPLKGMIVFNVDSNCIYLYKNNNTWASITTDPAPTQTWPYQSSDQVVGASGNGKGIVAITGQGLVASGNFSHAEGVNSIASGDHSYSLGQGDTASGNGSFAIGYANKAAGLYSSSIGFKNITSNQAAMAFGQENTDSGWASMAAGLRNRINSGVSYSNALGYANTVGGGSSNHAMGENNLVSAGRASAALGYFNIISANFSHALGSGNDILAGNSHTAAGENNTIKAGNGNSVFGQNNVADGSHLGVIGKDNIAFYQSAIAIGQGNRDSGYASLSAGLNNITYAGVQYSNAIGYNNLLKAGNSNSVLGEANIINGGNANSILGFVNRAEGNYNVLGGTSNNTEGGNANTLLGQGNFANGNSLVAMGRENSVFFQSAVALGQGNKDSGYASLSAGLNNIVRSGVQYSNLLGRANQVQAGSSNAAVGEENVIISGRGNAGFGYANTIDANFSSAFGTSHEILGGNSHFLAGENNLSKSGNANNLLGQSNTAEGNYLGAIGRDNTVYSQSAIALGQGNKDSGYASIAGGLTNLIGKNVQYSTVFGFNNQSLANPGIGTNGGSGSFTGGIANTNTGYGSIALGGSNRPTNAFSLAANFNNISNSHAMSAFGHFNDTTAAVPGVSYEPSEILFTIGNGINDNNRRNSFTMLRNGYTTINTTAEPGANIPRAELDVKGTGALIVPVGTTAERPVTPVVGMIRFCTDCAGGPVLQGYDGTAWVNL